MRHKIGIVAGRILLMAGLAVASAGSQASGAQAHATITEYLGPSTCVACHESEALEMHGSVHYQQTGPTPNVTNITGNAGKSELAFNTYCGTPTTSSRATCGGCHVSNGQYPSPVATSEQLNNIDCLMCHQDAYQRTAAPPYTEVPVVGSDGQPSTIRVPVEDENGFYYMPDEANMTISILEAAQTVHMPTRTSCLRCHAGASGSDGGKRGDMSSVTADPPRSSDIHMSSAEANLTCSDCHSVGNHRVRGRGLDLRPNDSPEWFTCARCHTDNPHGDRTKTVSMDIHASRVACQTCHIPTFAKDISTEVDRDWLNPQFSAAACSGQGGWKPEEIRASNVIPSYKWFDGTSYVYALGQVPMLNADSEYAMGVPNGSVSSAGAKLYPMKEHRTITAQHDASGELIPHSTFTFFATGDFDQAVRDGMSQAGLTGSYTLVRAHTYQTINHGVEDDHNALKCGDCHSDPLAERPFPGGPARMNLQTELGYDLKGSTDQVCTQCHRRKDSEDFVKTHDRHVTDKDFDCAWCHNFSRPERSLKLVNGK